MRHRRRRFGGVASLSVSCDAAGAHSNRGDDGGDPIDFSGACASSRASRGLSTDANEPLSTGNSAGCCDSGSAAGGSPADDRCAVRSVLVTRSPAPNTAKRVLQFFSSGGSGGQEVPRNDGGGGSGTGHSKRRKTPPFGASVALDLWETVTLFVSVGQPIAHICGSFTLKEGATVVQ